MKRFAALTCVWLLALTAAASAQTDVPLTPIPPAYPVSGEVRRLIETAVAELGVTEDSAGRTKYGAWYGNPSAEWCAEFLCWAVAQTEAALGVKMLQESFPLYGATNIGRDWYLKQGRYIARTGFVSGWGSQWYKGQETPMEKNSYVPQPGDWMFFSHTPSGDTTHVAMVEACYLDGAGQVIVQALEGNNPDKVQRARYRLVDWRIQGYGTVHDLADIVLRGGSDSLKVKKLQEQLAIIRLLGESDLTGVYNHRTQEAVRAFQAIARLPQTGIANQQTQLALVRFAHQWMMEHTEFWTVDGAV